MNKGFVRYLIMGCFSVLSIICFGDNCKITDEYLILGNKNEAAGPGFGEMSRV